MPRLPIPGSDVGTWGDILNEFLSVYLENDDTHAISADRQAMADWMDAMLECILALQV